MTSPERCKRAATTRRIEARFLECANRNMNKVTNELLRQEGLKLRLKILGLDSIHVAKGILGKEGLKPSGAQ